MSNPKNASKRLLVLFVLITSVFSAALALIFPLTSFHVSSLSLPWLKGSSENAYWIVDTGNLDETVYYSNSYDSQRYYDYLLSMEEDNRFLYVICNGQSIYPESKELGDVLRGVIVNQTAQNCFAYRVSSGRDFKTEDFLLEENKPIPVLIGSDLSEVLSLGDEFQATYFCKDCTFRIIGILDKDITLYRLDSPIAMGDRILIPAFFPAESDTSFFEKALLQCYFNSVIISSENTFEELYLMLWEKASDFNIGMSQFGRVAPLIQEFYRFRMLIGEFCAWCLPLLYIVLRFLVYGANISGAPGQSKHYFWKLAIIPLWDIVVYTVIFKLFYAPDFSYAIPWQYYALECIICILYRWSLRRKGNVKKA